MVDLMQILGEIPDVLVESASSRERRNAQAHRLIAPPPAGTPLLVSLAFAFEHTGIYLGDNRVAELNGDGHVKNVSLTQFINGASNDIFAIRNGTRIFAACDAKTRRPLANTRALMTANAALEYGMFRTDYDLLQVNCHLFTAACACGVLPGERRYHSLFGGGIASIGKLEKILSRAINYGRRTCWCAVRRDKDYFRYSLTSEKKARLAAEGVHPRSATPTKRCAK